MAAYNSILLVDDDEVSNFLNEDLIKDLNFASEIYIATNGEEALGFLKSECIFKKDCPDLILLDLNMPVMNGFEFLSEFEKLKSKLNVKVPIVVLTSSSNLRDMESVQKFEISGYINKPLTVKKLEGILPA